MDVLSDPRRRVQEALDIAEYTDPDHNSMIPHTVVLEPGLRVYDGKTRAQVFAKQD
jgi:hypothetical protein